MKRLFLAAGVAALAIAAPATAERGDRGGGKKGAQAAKVERGGGKARAERSNRGNQARTARADRGNQARATRAQRAPERRAASSERRGGREVRLATMRQEPRKGQAERARQQRPERAQQQRQARPQRQAGQQAQQQQQQRQARQQAQQQRQTRQVQQRRQERAQQQRQAQQVQQQRQGRQQAAMRAQREERQRSVQRTDRSGRDARVLFQRRDRGDTRVAIRDRDRNDRIRLRSGDDGRRVLLSDWRDRRLDLRDRDRIRTRGDGDRIRLRDRNRDNWFDRRYAARGIPASYFGCPPGLAKKNPPCVPPGQARSLIGQRLPDVYRTRYLPTRLRSYYRDTDDYYWRYGDGYLYRVRRDDRLIASVLPLIGLGLGIGQPFPYNSPAHFVPSYYQPFYPDTGRDYYRYANGYIYEVDGYTGLIEDIYPAFGYGYGVGQMLPASYSYYNVPYPYRSYYPDDDDYYYRYAPGAIYQVDRDSMLITAIASLLTGQNGLAVGQPLPIGYNTYNVPFDYRSRYYDTPDAWYRYSDGYIYQVDPTTRLITALITAIA